MSRCPPLYKYNYDNLTCTSQCTKGGLPFSYNKTCKSECKELYYWPAKDDHHTAECTATECDHYKETEFGYECQDYTNLAIFIVLGVVGGVILIIAILFLLRYCRDKGKCTNCTKKKSHDKAKLIDDELEEMEYVTLDKKGSDKEIQEVPLCPDIDAVPGVVVIQPNAQQNTTQNYDEPLM